MFNKHTYMYILIYAYPYVYNILENRTISFSANI